MIELLIIPHWIKKALESVNAPLSMAADPSLLLNILSFRDVVFYIVLNDKLFHSDKLHSYVTKSFIKPDLFNRIQQSGKVETDKFVKTYLELDNEYKNAGIIELFGDFDDYEFIKEEENQTIYHTKRNYYFELKNIHLTTHGNIMGYFVTPIENVDSMSNSDAIQIELKAIDKALNEVNTYLDFETLAKTDLFKEFILKTRHGFTL